MTLFPILTGALLLTAAASQPSPDVAGPAPGQLRWARGVVIAASADTLVLQLRSSTITLAIDESAKRPIGSVVEIHYSEKGDARRAVLVFDDQRSGAQELSKRPGRSFRGFVTKAKRSAMSVRVEHKTRQVGLDKHTRLTDAGGEAVANGSKAIMPLLAVGEPVLVKFSEAVDLVVGDMTLAGSETALEIRRYPQP